MNATQAAGRYTRFDAAETTRFHRDHRTNKTGFLGVGHKKARHGFAEGFEASIKDNSSGKKLYVGFAKTAEGAARLYDAKARELYGATAVTNFPAGNEQSAAGIVAGERWSVSSGRSG